MTGGEVDHISCVGGRQLHVRRMYRRQLASVICIQRYIRRLRLKLLKARYGVHQQVMIRICQSVVRGYLQRQRYRVMVGRVLLLQSFARMANARVAFRKQLVTVLRLQAWLRGRRALKNYQQIRRGIIVFEAI